jgi:chemotaxis protein histidine kinase CheA
MSSMLDSNSFVSEIVVSEKLLDLMREVSRDLAMRAVIECGKQYNFNGEEAIRVLGLGDLTVKTSKGKSLLNEKKERLPKKTKSSKSSKSSFPLPFSGLMNEGCCHGLKSNHGLYTQCTSAKGEGIYCAKCESQASVNANGKPDCGDIRDRVSVGLYEYKDSKGKSPIAYTKLMKKLNLSKEEVLSEALKMNVTIPEEHFEVVIESKRGRPKSEKVEKEPKGAKGRPKKTKKVLELADEEDLFSALVAKANNESTEEEKVEVVNVKEAEKAAKEKAKEEAKAAKEAEKAAKEKAKEEAKAAKEAEKAAKDKAKEEAKAAKEAEKAAKEAAKSAKSAKESKTKKSVDASSVVESSPLVASVESNKVVVEEDEPDVVKRIEYEGKKYLKSKKTGIIYNMEQDVVGKWNSETNKIEFMDDEECESDYEE